MLLYVILILLVILLLFAMWSHYTKPGHAELAKLEASLRIEIAAARAEIGNLKSRLKGIK